jgi:short chain dehydrogenase
MNLQLTGKRALVTGSSSGSGKAIAWKLAEEGASVVVTGRDRKRADAVAQAIRTDTKGAAVSIAADLSTDEGAEVLAEELGGIDILVNNAGLLPSPESSWWNTTPAEWAKVYNQNVVSIVRLVQRLGPRMREAGWGRVINISSGGAWQPFANMADYTATQAGPPQSDCKPSEGICRQRRHRQRGQPRNYCDGIDRALFPQSGAGSGLAGGVERGREAPFGKLSSQLERTTWPARGHRQRGPLLRLTVVGLRQWPNYRVDAGSTMSIN